jgi:hypothetical protein
MSIAVLKNRLLELTDRTFDESDYGERTISDLVRRLPDLLAIDETTRPPTAYLLEDQPAGLPDIVQAHSSRIRPDLWNAAIDYSSNLRYYWNGAAAVREDAASPEEVESLAVLPTLSATEMGQWRAQFVLDNRRLIDDDPDVLRQAERWRDSHLRTVDLPAPLRALWNTTLKELVQQRITDWFAAESFQVPADLLQSKPPPTRPARPTPADALRQLIIKCVQVMSYEELRELRLPPTAVLRAKL